MAGWIPIDIATRGIRGGGDPDDIYTLFARYCFKSSVLCGITAIGWYGAIFASRRAFKRVPIRTAYRQMVNNPTFPVHLGVIPLAFSLGTGISGALCCGMRAMNRIWPDDA